jgi:putative transposase
LDLLHAAVEKHRKTEPFDLIAWVVIPDHWHFVIDVRYNRPDALMKKIKLTFASSYRYRKGMRSGQVWQNRYWDHVIRDQEDLNRHIDYIHFNPVKHGLVLSAASYEHSSFRDYVQRDCVMKPGECWNLPTLGMGTESEAGIRRKEVGTAGVPTYEFRSEVGQAHLGLDVPEV